MIFAIETEEQTLHVFENEITAVAYCEGLDVEAAIWMFWDEQGFLLKPVFTIKNIRGLFSVKNGTYHLEKAREPDCSCLLEVLENVVAVEGIPPLNSIEAIRHYLTHSSSDS